MLEDGRPGIEELCMLLIEKIGPLTFIKMEVDMLFKTELPIRELMKLFFLVDQIKKKCEGQFAKIAGPDFKREGEEYGFEIYDTEKKHLFWFGLWSPFWQETGKPLSFGIDESSCEYAKKAFSQAYHGPTRKFGTYTVAWIPEEDLLLDGKSGDAEGKVWNRIKPILDAIQDAATQNATK
jgi:hypothetical protein